MWFPVVLMTWMAPVALGADTWTSVRTGVDLLHRTTATPQDIWAARIDLSQSNIALHASADRSGVERAVNTRTFARNVGAVVAINTDWSNGSTPVGLAISDGWQWHDHIPDDGVGGHWGYVGCTLEKDCTIDRERPLDVAWWFTEPTAAPYRFHHATGANGIVMLRDGVAGSGCYDTARNPRSAICVEADGVHLWMIAIDGRRSGAAGMTCDEVRDLMLDLGCWDGGMFDGGGSTTLVVEGDVVNVPSDGSPRTVSNHLGVLVHDTADAACVVANGRFCEGTAMRTCQGGVETAWGDCATYGATCEEDGDYAYCVDHRCPGGDGQGAVCLDTTRVAACADGRYSEGDCGAFGLVCGADAGGTSCMDPACEAGPNSAFCTAEGLLGSCAEGAFTSSTCADGSACFEDATQALCVDDRCDGPDAGACAGDVWTGCTGGVYADVDCAASGQVCDEAAGGCAPAGDDGGGGSGGGSGGDGGAGYEDPQGSLPTTEPPPPVAEGCGCAGAGARGAARGGVAGLLALVALVGTRRRARRGAGGPA